MPPKNIQLIISEQSVKCIWYSIKGNDYYQGTYSIIKYLKENVLPGRKSIFLSDK